MSKVSEDRVLQIAHELYEHSMKEQPGFFNKDFWSGKIMDWAMKKPDFKMELFRFIDVLPTLKSSEQISKHLKAYFMKPGMELSPFVKSALGMAASGGFLSKIASSSIKSNVQTMARNFIVGEDAERATKKLKKLWEGGLASTVDILGEAVVSEKEAEDYFKRYLNLICELPGESQKWRDQEILEKSPLHTQPRVNVSVKCSSLYSQINPFAFRASVDAIKNKVRILLEHAVQRNVFIYLDMEQEDYREIILKVAEELYTEDSFKDYPHLGIVLQTYLKSAREDIRSVNQWSSKRTAPLYVRLVKGAYWDFENILASQKDWPVPVYQSKEDTDYNYERCVDDILEFYPRLVPAFASHNLRSLSYSLAAVEKAALPDLSWEIQMLYGMAEPYKKLFNAKNIRVREYAPVGEMLPGMAYLVRRLLENTSNEGFLKAQYVDEAGREKLFKKPELSPEHLDSAKQEATAFKNLAQLDFSKEENREKRLEAYKLVKEQLPIPVKAAVPESFEKNIIYEKETQSYFCPFDLESEFTRLSLVESSADFINALGTHVSSSQKTWSQVSVKERSKIILKTAELLEERRLELTALISLEVGKDFYEADADLCEAVDFCRYYAHEILSATKERPMSDHILGESNVLKMRARGPSLVISPWNFPLAILCGMTVAPLLCGNVVILKAAEESSAIASEFVKILLEAGLPQEALFFLPGRGEALGADLVRSSFVHVINFTGSQSVGSDIMQAASQFSAGQKHIKKVIAEMGGKNALIIDDDADLDEAVQGALYSAFAFQGQKCSALSRLLVHEDVYEAFKERFLEGLKSMKLGPSEDPAVKIGAVITRASQERLEAVIEKHKSEILFQKEIPEVLKSSGYYVAPTIFESQSFESSLGQEEFFGPLLTLFKVSSIEEAVERMNAVDFALTGGIYSRNPDSIEYVKSHAEVGNLYINRGITGAIVARQPFGGYKLSGVGAKAGGPDYLMQFLEPYTCTENTMRRGFSPDL